MTHRLTGVGLLAGCVALAGCNDINEPVTTTPSSPETPSLAIAANSWVTRANNPSVQRQGFATAPIKNSAGQYVVYMIGGATVSGGSLSNNLAYNVSTNTWSWKKPLPVPLYHTNGVGVIGGKLYISGGMSGSKSSSNALYMYDPVANTWTQKASMPGFNYAGVTGVINNKLYVYTQCFQAECSSAFYRYDPVTNRWTTLPTANTADGYARWHGSGTGGVTGGKFYVVGGSVSPELDVYDPVGNRWSTGAPLPKPRWEVAGGILQGKLYVIGGHQGEADGSISTNVRTNSVYDPATNRWTDKAPLPAGRSNFSASPVALDGQLRMGVFGGPTPNNLAYIP